MIFDSELIELHSFPLQIPQNGLLKLLSQKGNFVFIKNRNSEYQYANPQFLDLMGLISFKQLYRKTDYDLCDEQKKINVYRQHDEEVIESEKILSVCEEILPLKNKFLKKQMIGKIYPIFSESKPAGVMGIVKSKYLPFKLTLETAFSLTPEELYTYFIRRSYSIKVYDKKITLSKREIQCIIEYIKGKNAKEIAETFTLKQSTIEYYLNNIKEKLGATSKSSLIMTVFNQQIIQQIIL